MRIALIVCGALGHEVQRIVSKYGWDVHLYGISAAHHLRPDRIVRAVKAHLQRLREDYDRVIVVYGDCGTYGALDRLLHGCGVKRIHGPHCYEMYAGDDFQRFLTEDAGTYFLTDFMVRTFRGTILKGMGLDRYPELKNDYFRHYQRILYLTQQPDPLLMSEAGDIAAYLELPLEVRVTGYNQLESRLVQAVEAAGLEVEACP